MISSVSSDGATQRNEGESESRLPGGMSKRTSIVLITIGVVAVMTTSTSALARVLGERRLGEHLTSLLVSNGMTVEETVVLVGHAYRLSAFWEKLDEVTVRGNTPKGSSRTHLVLGLQVGLGEKELGSRLVLGDVAGANLVEVQSSRDAFGGRSGAKELGLGVHIHLKVDEFLDYPVKPCETKGIPC